MNLDPAVIIRPMLPSDAAEAAALSAELGYPVDETVMQERLRRLAGGADHVVFAACLQEQVVGWIDVGIVQHLQSETYGEIGGLVVSKSHHGRGIGRSLVQAAEKWIADQNVATVLVRSQIARDGAHAFYLRQSYIRTKTSAVFTKHLRLS